MPNQPTPPDNAHIGDEPKKGVLRKIDFVCRRIVLGQAATNSWAIRYYRLHTALTVILSVIGSFGLVKGQYELAQRQAATAMTTGDWATLIGALVALLLAIILELYRAFGVDKTAMQAISAEDSFSRLLKELENALENSDPTSDLQQVWEKAKALGTNFHDVLKGEPHQEDVDRLIEKMVNQFQNNWTFPPTKRKGKSR